MADGVADGVAASVAAGAPGGYSAAAPPPDPASSMGNTTERTIPRTETRRLVAGRGRFTGDLTAPRLLHAAFLRSPVAHGRIVALDVSAARAMPGVAAVLTADELRSVCKPMVTRMAAIPEHRPPPQPALAEGSVHYQGEPVALAARRQSRPGARRRRSHPARDRGDAAGERLCRSGAPRPQGPPGVGRQHHAATPIRGGRSFAGGIPAALRLRAPDRRAPGRPRRARRLRSGGGVADGVPVRPGAAPDAAGLGRSARPAAAPGPGRLPGCRRRLRYQAARLCRRAGGRRGVAPARPAGQMGGRPAGVLPVGRPCPGIHDRRRSGNRHGRQDRGLRRDDGKRRRRLFGPSARQRRRGFPDRDHDRRGLYGGTGACGSGRESAEQGADGRLPRRRPAGRHGGVGSVDRRRGLAARPRSAGSAPAQLSGRRQRFHERRRNPGRCPVLPRLPRPTRSADGLSGPAGGSGCGAGRRRAGSRASAWRRWSS